MKFTLIHNKDEQILYYLPVQLKPVEFLLGSTAKLGEIIVLGMLTQLKEV